MQSACSMQQSAMTMNSCPQRGTPLKRVLALLACILAVAIFVFGIGPWLEQSRVMKPIAQFIEENDISANMYFYTEVEEFSEANINMNNSMAYPPRQMGK